MSNFDTLLEKELERFQCGGFLVGDRIRFKSNALKHEYIQKRSQALKDIIASCMEPSFDLNLRIGAIKSIYPTSATNFQAGHSAPDGSFADIYIEYAPGLFRNPMTVPIDLIELMDDKNHRGPIPDSVKRPNNVHGPEEFDTSYDLASNNTNLPGANAWDDTKPGAGNFNV